MLEKGSTRDARPDGCTIDFTRSCALQILAAYFLLLPLREDAGISLGMYCSSSSKLCCLRHHVALTMQWHVQQYHNFDLFSNLGNDLSCLIVQHDQHVASIWKKRMQGSHHDTLVSLLSCHPCIGPARTAHVSQTPFHIWHSASQ
jgi:hypothetical protein